MTQYQQSNYWIGIREDKVMKLQQQGLAIPNPDSVKPPKLFIPDKYKIGCNKRNTRGKSNLLRKPCNLELEALVKRR